MKAALIIPLFMILAIGLAEAAVVEIEVTEILKGETKFFQKSIQNNMLEVSTELYNVGSLGFTARERIDILKDDSVISTIWSDEKRISPGSRETFDLYWYNFNISGEFTAQTRFYYANEIFEDKRMEFTIEQTEPSDVFQISDFRTSDDFVRFLVTSSENVDSIIVIPSNPQGWIFEQAKTEEIGKGETTEILLPYKADYFSERPISIMLVTGNGEYFHEETFTLKKEEGLGKFFTMFLDFIKGIFRSF